MATVCTVDSPTDCPAVYESVLVRERLLPLVFAVSQTGKMCENTDFFPPQHYNCYSYFILSTLYFLFLQSHKKQQHCSDIFRFTKIELFLLIFTNN